MSAPVDVLAVLPDDAARVARLAGKARAINRDLVRTLTGDWVATPEYLRWHRAAWMSRARKAKIEAISSAALARVGGAA